MTDEDILIAMETYGGSFVRALALAFRHADVQNQARLRTAFADVWEKYRKLATMRDAGTSV